MKGRDLFGGSGLGGEGHGEGHAPQNAGLTRFLCTRGPEASCWGTGWVAECTISTPVCGVRCVRIRRESTLEEAAGAVKQAVGNLSGQPPPPPQIGHRIRPTSPNSADFADLFC